MKITKFVAAAAAVAALTLGLAACSTSSTDQRQEQLQNNQSKFDDRTPPNVTGDAEYSNYIKAQEDVYDNPATIIWCTAAFPSDVAPIFTVPIAGKLTSSSVSYFPNQGLQVYLDPDLTPDTPDESRSYTVDMGENQSVDGMYHGSPGPYRYGFTPGGQYVDFTNLAVFCTTQLTEFQRQTLKVANVDPGDSATDKAEVLLQEALDAEKAGDAATAEAKRAEAQKLLDGLSE